MSSGHAAAKIFEDPEAFWQTESMLAEQRLADPALRQAAFDDLKEETTRLVYDAYVCIASFFSASAKSQTALDTRGIGRGFELDATAANTP